MNFHLPDAIQIAPKLSREDRAGIKGIMDRRTALEEAVEEFLRYPTLRKAKLAGVVLDTLLARVAIWNLYHENDTTMNQVIQSDVEAIEGALTKLTSNEVRTIAMELSSQIQNGLRSLGEESARG